MLFCQLDCQATIGRRHAKHDDRLYSGISGALDRRCAIGIELTIVDVAVGVDKTHRYAERRASPSATEVSILGKSASGSRSVVPGCGRMASQPPDSMAPEEPSCS